MRLMLPSVGRMRKLSMHLPRAIERSLGEPCARMLGVLSPSARLERRLARSCAWRTNRCRRLSRGPTGAVDGMPHHDTTARCDARGNGSGGTRAARWMHGAADSRCARGVDGHESKAAAAVAVEPQTMLLKPSWAHLVHAYDRSHDLRRVASVIAERAWRKDGVRVYQLHDGIAWVDVCCAADKPMLRACGASLIGTWGRGARWTDVLAELRAAVASA